MQRDPVERAADNEDLQGVATWEPRSRVDGVVTWIHGAILPTVRLLLVLFSGLLIAGLVAGGVLSPVLEPDVAALVALSAVPALLLAAYVRRADVTTKEPLWLLVATFLLGVLFAPFAGILNSQVTGGAGLESLPLLVVVPFFFLVVGPVEETVKLLAVRLYAYRDSRFDAVVDGAVYGAAAGLGFATIENAIYIAQQIAENGESVQFGITAVRALAGPGHVIYSGIAGYYLGLAKFNAEHAGPLVLKGIAVAAVVHAGYNTLVGLVPGLLDVLAGVPVAVGFLGFVVVYDTLAGYYLYRLLKRYERAYHAVGAGPRDPDSELTEFDDGASTGRQRTGAETDAGDARRD